MAPHISVLRGTAKAEFEGNVIRKRTLAGLKAVRARGRVGGRPEKLSVRDKQQIRAAAQRPPKFASRTWRAASGSASARCTNRWVPWPRRNRLQPWPLDTRTVSRFSKTPRSKSRAPAGLPTGRRDQASEPGKLEACKPLRGLQLPGYRRWGRPPGIGQSLGGSPR
jgi:hypothetical protein